MKISIFVMLFDFLLNHKSLSKKNNKTLFNIEKKFHKNKR